jgi:glycosyltransferase involved in cell wall biosynthesis
VAGEGVTVTGAVPDVTPYLDEAAVVAAPLRMGGGMRVKVLEALAAGKAVVATPLAVEGLQLTAGEQVEVAAGDEQFARSLERLVRDEARRRELASSARRWAAENLGWAPVVASYERLYAELAGA